MKKNFLAFATVVALAAVAVVGGTMAYFTDTDEADNTFTVGNVNISLIEQQRNTANSDMLSPYIDGSTLMPAVVVEGEEITVTNGDNDSSNDVTLPVEANYNNYIDKIIRVTNTGKSEAYVRAFIAIPEALDNGMLHLVQGVDTDWDELVSAGKAEIDGITYNVYSRICSSAVKSYTTTTPAFAGVYLDSDVDADEEGNLMYNGETVPASEYTVNGKVVIPVFAQAIQTAGFDSADVAFATEALPANPWAE